MKSSNQNRQQRPKIIGNSSPYHYEEDAHLQEQRHTEQYSEEHLSKISAKWKTKSLNASPKEQYEMKVSRLDPTKDTNAIDFNANNQFLIDMILKTHANNQPAATPKQTNNAQNETAPNSNDNNKYTNNNTANEASQSVFSKILTTLKIKSPPKVAKFERNDNRAYNDNKSNAFRQLPCPKIKKLNDFSFGMYNHLATKTPNQEQNTNILTVYELSTSQPSNSNVMSVPIAETTNNAPLNIVLNPLSTQNPGSTQQSVPIGKPRKTFKKIQLALPFDIGLLETNSDLMIAVSGTKGGLVVYGGRGQYRSPDYRVRDSTTSSNSDMLAGILSFVRNRLNCRNIALQTDQTKIYGITFISKHQLVVLCEDGILLYTFRSDINTRSSVNSPNGGQNADYKFSRLHWGSSRSNQQYLRLLHSSQTIATIYQNSQLFHFITKPIANSNASKNNSSTKGSQNSEIQAARQVLYICVINIKAIFNQQPNSNNQNLNNGDTNNNPSLDAVIPTIQVHEIQQLFQGGIFRNSRVQKIGQQMFLLSLHEQIILLRRNFKRFIVWDNVSIMATNKAQQKKGQLILANQTILVYSQASQIFAHMLFYETDKLCMPPIDSFKGNQNSEEVLYDALLLLNEQNCITLVLIYFREAQIDIPKRTKALLINQNSMTSTNTNLLPFSVICINQSEPVEKLKQLLRQKKPMTEINQYCNRFKIQPLDKTKCMWSVCEKSLKDIESILMEISDDAFIETQLNNILKSSPHDLSFLISVQIKQIARLKKKLIQLLFDNESVEQQQQVALAPTHGIPAIEESPSKPLIPNKSARVDSLLRALLDSLLFQRKLQYSKSFLAFKEYDFIEIGKIKAGSLQEEVKLLSCKKYEKRLIYFLNFFKVYAIANYKQMTEFLIVNKSLQDVREFFSTFPFFLPKWANDPSQAFTRHLADNEVDIKRIANSPTIMNSSRQAALSPKSGGSTPKRRRSVILDKDKVAIHVVREEEESRCRLWDPLPEYYRGHSTQEQSSKTLEQIDTIDEFEQAILAEIKGLKVKDQERKQAMKQFAASFQKINHPKTSLLTITSNELARIFTKLTNRGAYDCLIVYLYKNNDKKGVMQLLSDLVGQKLIPKSYYCSDLARQYVFQLVRPNIAAREESDNEHLNKQQIEKSLVRCVALPQMIAHSRALSSLSFGQFLTMSQGQYFKLLIEICRKEILLQIRDKYESFCEGFFQERFQMFLGSPQAKVALLLTFVRDEQIKYQPEILVITIEALLQKLQVRDTQNCKELMGVAKTCNFAEIVAQSTNTSSIGHKLHLVWRLSEYSELFMKLNLATKCYSLLLKACTVRPLEFIELLVERYCETQESSHHETNPSIIVGRLNESLQLRRKPVVLFSVLINLWQQLQLMGCVSNILRIMVRRYLQRDKCDMVVQFIADMSNIGNNEINLKSQFNLGLLEFKQKFNVQELLSTQVTKWIEAKLIQFTSSPLLNRSNVSRLKSLVGKLKKVCQHSSSISREESFLKLIELLGQCDSSALGSICQIKQITFQGSQSNSFFIFFLECMKYMRPTKLARSCVQKQNFDEQPSSGLGRTILSVFSHFQIVRGIRSLVTEHHPDYLRVISELAHSFCHCGQWQAVCKLLTNCLILEGFYYRDILYRLAFYVSAMPIQSVGDEAKSLLIEKDLQILKRTIIKITESIRRNYRRHSFESSPDNSNQSLDKPDEPCQINTQLDQSPSHKVLNGKFTPFATIQLDQFSYFLVRQPAISLKDAIKAAQQCYSVNNSRFNTESQQSLANSHVWLLAAYFRVLDYIETDFYPTFQMFSLKSASFYSIKSPQCRQLLKDICLALAVGRQLAAKMTEKTAMNKNGTAQFETVDRLDASPSSNISHGNDGLSQLFQNTDTDNKHQAEILVNSSFSSNMSMYDSQLSYLQSESVSKQNVDVQSKSGLDEDSLNQSNSSNKNELIRKVIRQYDTYYILGKEIVLPAAPHIGANQQGHKNIRNSVRYMASHQEPTYYYYSSRASYSSRELSELCDNLAHLYQGWVRNNGKPNHLNWRSAQEKIDNEEVVKYDTKNSINRKNYNINNNITAQQQQVIERLEYTEHTLRQINRKKPQLPNSINLTDLESNFSIQSPKSIQNGINSRNNGADPSKRTIVSPKSNNSIINNIRTNNVFPSSQPQLSNPTLSSPPTLALNPSSFQSFYPPPSLPSLSPIKASLNDKLTQSKQIETQQLIQLRQNYSSNTIDRVNMLIQKVKIKKMEAMSERVPVRDIGAKMVGETNYNHSNIQSINKLGNIYNNTYANITSNHTIQSVNKMNTNQQSGNSLVSQKIVQNDTTKTIIDNKVPTNKQLQSNSNSNSFKSLKQHIRLQQQSSQESLSSAYEVHVHSPEHKSRLQSDSNQDQVVSKERVVYQNRRNSVNTNTNNKGSKVSEWPSFRPMIPVSPPMSPKNQNNNKSNMKYDNTNTNSNINNNSNNNSNSYKTTPLNPNFNKKTYDVYENTPKEPLKYNIPNSKISPYYPNPTPNALKYLSKLEYTTSNIKLMRQLIHRAYQECNDVRQIIGWVREKGMVGSLSDSSNANTQNNKDNPCIQISLKSIQFIQSLTRIGSNFNLKELINPSILLIDHIQGRQYQSLANKYQIERFKGLDWSMNDKNTQKEQCTKIFILLCENIIKIISMSSNINSVIQYESQPINPSPTPPPLHSLSIGIRYALGGDDKYGYAVYELWLKQVVWKQIRSLGQVGDQSQRGYIGNQSQRRYMSDNNGTTKTKSVNFRLEQLIDRLRLHYPNMDPSLRAQQIKQTVTILLQVDVGSVPSNAQSIRQLVNNIIVSNKAFNTNNQQIDQIILSSIQQ